MSLIAGTETRAIVAERAARFDRLVARLDVPKILLHDLRHTHATLLIKDGEALKVVSERLGHANPAFTMTTYQHVLPGIGADAANRFARLVTSKVAPTGGR